MNTRQDYSPPTSSSIKKRQNEDDALRLLIAQRRLYRQAKRWLALRWLGMLVIGLGAPVVSVLWPSLAVVSGAVAGAWIFLGRTALGLAQSRLTSQAASVQEQFDFFVFGMPDSTARSTLPSRERIAAVAGPDEAIRETAKSERLLDWYPVDAANPGSVTVATSQRANASYTDGLLRTTAIAWGVATAVWCILLIVVSIWADVTLENFLLGVFLPVLPAFLDVVQYVFGVWRSANDRRDLARAIEDRLAAGSLPDSHELLVWQEQLFDLRRGAPQAPDAIYKLRWKTNERAMRSAADQLSRRARGGK
jgi:hypothetical protein